MIQCMHMAGVSSVVILGVFQVPRVEPLDLLKEANAASKTSLWSGVGKCSFTRNVQRLGEQEARVIEKGVGLVEFDGKRFSIKVSYDVKDAFQTTSRIIINDGTMLATSRRFQSIRKEKVQGEIWEGGNDANLPLGIGFPFNPCLLADATLDIEALLKTYKGRIKTEMVKDGSYRGSYRDGTLTARFEFSESDGYNVSSYLAYIDGRDVPYQRSKATWEKIGDVWIVKALDQETNSFIEGRTQVSFRYNSFEPNVPNAQARFKLNELQLPLGSRILDQRPGAENKVLRSFPQQ